MLAKVEDASRKVEKKSGLKVHSRKESISIFSKRGLFLLAIFPSRAQEPVGVASGLVLEHVDHRCHVFGPGVTGHVMDRRGDIAAVSADPLDEPFYLDSYL